VFVDTYQPTLVRKKISNIRNDVAIYCLQINKVKGIYGDYDPTLGRVPELHDTMSEFVVRVVFCAAVRKKGEIDLIY